MNKHNIHKMYEHGAIFIILNVPEGTQFGIDMKSWNTGEKFRDSTGDTAPRTGFFHNFKTGEVLVKKWDKLNECISKEEVCEKDVVGLKDNIKALDGFLGPYPYDIYEKWSNLTTHISEKMMNKLIPQNGYILSVLELESCTDADRPRASKLTENSTEICNIDKEPKRMRLSANTEDSFLPHLKAKEGTELQVTEFPEKNYPVGSTPSEITKHSMDSSFLLDSMLSIYSESSEILGELQFCYICFLVGHSLEAFEQWKKLFGLLCSCEVAIKKHRKLFDLFLSSIELQVKEIPEDFLADIVSNNNFVYVKLRQFFRTIQESDIDGILRGKTERLKEKLTQSLQWDFGHLDSEDENDAPVVVDIDKL